MTFMTLDDLHVIIRAERLQQVIDEDATVLVEAEKSAIAIVKDALSRQYDIENIFDNTNRPPQVVRWVRNIMLYDIAGRLPEKMVSERLVKNYDDTIATLQDIELGKKTTTLPPLGDSTVDGVTTHNHRFRYGSDKKRTHGF